MLKRKLASEIKFEFNNSHSQDIILQLKVLKPQLVILVLAFLKFDFAREFWTKRFLRQK